MLFMPHSLIKHFFLKYLNFSNKTISYLKCKNQCWGAGTFFHQLTAPAPSEKGLAFLKIYFTGSGFRLPCTVSWLPGTGSRLPGTDSRLPGTVSQLPFSGDFYWLNLFYRLQLPLKSLYSRLPGSGGAPTPVKTFILKRIFVSYIKNIKKNPFKIDPDIIISCMRTF